MVRLRLTFISIPLILLTIISCSKAQNIDSNIYDISHLIDSEIKKNEYLINFSTNLSTEYITDKFTFPNYSYNASENTIVLMNDTVYKKEVNGYKKFSGIIRVLGKLDIVDENLIAKRQTQTLGLFNIKDGIFFGDQLYLTKDDKGNELYLKTKIVPFLDMIAVKDYIEVDDEKEGDFNFGDVTYKYINRPNYDLDISMYWISGKLAYNNSYNFNFVQYTYSNFSRQYAKLLIASTQNNIKLYHYNGNLAFEGQLNKDAEILSGEYYTFNNIKTDKKHFQLQTSYDKESPVNGNLNLPDKIYKQFRKYFGVIPLGVDKNTLLPEAKNYESVLIGDLEIMTTDFNETLTWEDAKTSIEALGDGWRLPSIKELKMMYDNKERIGGFSNDDFEDTYWSSQKFDSEHAYGINFITGRIEDQIYVQMKFSSRAVRNSKK
jgi:hypothetical protein